MSSANCFLRHRQRQIDLAISDAFARLRGDAQACAAFAALLDLTRRRAPGVLQAAMVSGRHPGLYALEQLARAADGYVRDPAAWGGATGGWHSGVQSLARHLLALHPIPAFLASAWYATPEEACADAQRAWFVQHGAGRSFRSLDLPLRMTRRMEHLFLGSPAHAAIPQALRRAELAACGADAALADAILATRPARMLEHGEFWRTAWRFLIANTGTIRREQVAPLIDFLDGIRHERIEVETPDGLEVRDPPEPDFSLKGRTARSVLRRMHEWHRSLGRTSSAARWTPSPLKPMRVEFPAEDPRLPPVEWLLVELTSAAALRSEGSAQGHCVATYARRCAAGDARIWSLRRRRGEAAPRPVLTIEIDPWRQAIVQMRGRFNRLPEGRPFQIARSWAARERLRILRL